MKPDKSLRHLFFLVLFTLILAPCLMAQDKTEHRLIRLLWAADAYALHYEVLIESEGVSGNQQVLRKITGFPYLEASLPQGKYRFRVIPYDFLEKPGASSPWVSFEIKRAIVPEPPPIEIAVQPESPEIEIEYNETAVETEPVPIPEPAPEPEPVFTFVPGPAKIRKISPYISAAWMPLLPAYGDIGTYFGKKPIIIGAGMRFGILFLNLKLFKPGLELSGSWYKYDLHTCTAGLNLVVQKDISRYTALRMHLGADILIYDNNIKAQSIAGLLFLIYPHPHFYFEAGFDYAHIFTKSAGDHTGSIRPVLGMGWQMQGRK